MFESILSAYNLNGDSTSVEAFGSGLIHKTWKVTLDTNEYILQQVNDSIFREPENIAYNINLLAGYLHRRHPGYLFVAPLHTEEGKTLVHDKGYFRLFSFVKGSHSLDSVESPAQAYEAAVQFGRFTRLLSGFNANELKITIPSFHDLSLRYRQFLTALEEGNRERVQASKILIQTLLSYEDIVDEFNAIKTNSRFKLRVTHHDTKISNVLFDENEKGVCVVDLDTVMPGYFISDVGDMMRTYLSPASEEEDDFSKIEIREAFYGALVQGYYSEMKDELSVEEREHFFYAGKFMIYMQALRFFTDHLNNDRYYGARYPDHNFIRASNQAILLQRLIEKGDSLKKIL